jgi:hypothetical protein
MFRGLSPQTGAGAFQRLGGNNLSIPAEFFDRTHYIAGCVRTMSRDR